MRLIAIGDIHGHLDKLEKLLQLIKPTDSDKLVFLGDYIDRGPDSAGVVDHLIQLPDRFPQTVFLRGNHEQVAMDALVSCVPGCLPGYRPLVDLDPWYAVKTQYRDGLGIWLRNDGAVTLNSYGINLPVADEDLGRIPQTHVDFLSRTKLWHQESGFLFVHAGAREGRPMDQQINTLLRDRYCPPGTQETHVVGHQVTPDVQPYFEPGRYNFDTGAGNGKALTACNVLTREFWQA